jgi:hypothetical protein
LFEILIRLKRENILLQQIFPVTSIRKAAKKGS